MFFFGLANQLATSTDKIADLLELLHLLLTTKNEFVWIPDHEQDLCKAKEHLATAPVLVFLHGKTNTFMHRCHQTWHRIHSSAVNSSRPMVSGASRDPLFEQCRITFCNNQIGASSSGMGSDQVQDVSHWLQHFKVIMDHNTLIPILNSHSCLQPMSGSPTIQ